MLMPVETPAELSAAGQMLMAENNRGALRTLGQQSFSRFVAQSLCGGDAAGLWEWLAQDDQLQAIEAMFMFELDGIPHLHGASRARLRKLIRGNRSLLDTSKPTRWWLLREVAARIHVQATAPHPDCSAAERHLRQLAACWAWCVAACDLVTTRYSHSSAYRVFAGTCTPWTASFTGRGPSSRSWASWSAWLKSAGSSLPRRSGCARLRAHPLTRPTSPSIRLLDG